MLGIGLETTNRCNLDCLHCLRERSLALQDLPIALFEKVIKQVKGLGKVTVGLTGGEPTLHPQFEYIINTFSKERIPFNIVTNGWNFRKVYPLFLKDRGTKPKMITFSLDGAKEQTHDKMRERGSFRKVMQAITICRAKGIPFSMQMVICEFNKEEMEKMCFLASDLHAAALSFAYPFPTPMLIKSKGMISPDGYEAIAKKVHKLASALRIPITASSNSMLFADDYLYECCIFSGNVVNIDYRGNLTFCCNLSGYVGKPANKLDIIGSLKKESFFQLYKRFLKILYIFHKDRFDNIRDQKGRNISSGCLYCLKYFRKLDWVKNFPKNSWFKFRHIKD